MKKTLFFIVIFGITIGAIAQQIPLKGVVTVQNSKTYTGKTHYVKNAEVTHPNAKSDVTDDDGNFTLNITGLKQNIQTQITVTLYGAYNDYVVVNEKELQSITLGRITPVGVYICKKGDLEQRQAEMVGINMRKLEERMEADKKRLQKELDALRQNNDYLNVRCGEIKDSLNIISKNIDNAFERIKEYAQTMVLENLDDKDNNYIKAYDCFSRGELDSVSYYLSDYELDLKYQKVLQLQEEAKKEKELAEILTESAKAKEEYSENSLSNLIKEWLLLARTYGIKYDYDKAMLYYEKVIEVAPLNTETFFEYAKYLYSIREYNKAEKYFPICLEQYRALEKKNPKIYSADVAMTLLNLTMLHSALNEHPQALEACKEALEIYQNLAEENPETYLPHKAKALNELACSYFYTNDFSKALELFKEILDICRKLAAENPETYLVDMAGAWGNLANSYRALAEYSKALEGFEEALEIYKKLTEENPKAHLTKMTHVLNNLAILYYQIDKYKQALESFEEALNIHKKLAEENPKAHLSDIANISYNMALVHSTLNENSQALEKFKEALEIYGNLAAESPKAYLPNMAKILKKMADLYSDTNEYRQTLEKYEKALEIYK